MSYQIGNVLNPNKSANTVVFSVFEAKDTLPNLRLCLDRFVAHIKKLYTINFSNLYVWQLRLPLLHVWVVRCSSCIPMPLVLMLKV